MSFIETTPAEQARGETLAMYERYQAMYGYIPNYAKVFCHRPQVMERWGRLLSAIRKPMTARRFELATFAAAQALKNTYCSLAHGQALGNFLTAPGLRSLSNDEAEQPTTGTEQAIMSFARKVAVDAAAITRSDIESLRHAGLDDGEIFDIAATAAGRAFFTKILDALGVLADSEYLAIDDDLRRSLTVGRPIDTGPTESLLPTRDSPGSGINGHSLNEIQAR